MATQLRMKRMLREREALQKPNDDYFVQFEDDNLFTFYAYVCGPVDTLYAYKFVKLKIEIPERYPLIPPKCTFIQHSGGRIHPNLYVEGKVCLSILGTWPGEPWALAMSVETDDSPYKHEPHQHDNKDFNHYVEYTTWQSLLVDYLHNEKNPAAKAVLEKHISKNGTVMIQELQQQAKANVARKVLSSPYIHSNSQGQKGVDYPSLIQKVSKTVRECEAAEATRQASSTTTQSILSENTIATTEKLEVVDNLNTKSNAKRIKVSEAAKPTQPVVAIKAKDATCLPKPATPKINLMKKTSKAKSSPLKRKHEVIDLTGLT